MVAGSTLGKFMLPGFVCTAVRILGLERGYMFDWHIDELARTRPKVPDVHEWAGSTRHWNQLLIIDFWPRNAAQIARSKSLVR
jgi:hypothetical protein